MNAGILLLSLVILVPGCASHTKTTSTEVLETGARVLQSNTPASQLDVHLVGFHPMKEHPSHQMEAHHFCRQVSEDFTQCALFDGNTEAARLNGIEYIVSEKLFNELPEKERKFWHPHNYEILSGQLFAPGLPEVAEKAFLRKKMNSYGKTWHVWNQTDKLPFGDPMLAWSFNRDGEANPEMLEKAEKKFDIKLRDKRDSRKDLKKLARPQRGTGALFPVR